LNDTFGSITHSYSMGAITGYAYIGGLAGVNSGSILQSYATGTTTGTIVSGFSAGWGIGGLIGGNTGRVAQSYATGMVNGSASEYVGGLVGWNYTSGGSILQSYATGAVNGAYFTGGLVGYNDGVISQSYATGTSRGFGFGFGFGSGPGGLVGYNTGAVTNSYWDIQTSGQSTSAGGVGLTTAERKSGLPSGFDPTIWASNSGVNNGYPYLRSVAPTP
jgi:hypothetical protein